MTLLRVDSSIRTEGSVSREVADSLEEAWSRRHPGRSSAATSVATRSPPRPGPRP